MPATCPMPAEPAAEYRRAARRLRGRFRGDPAGLQRSLRDLARQTDAGDAALGDSRVDVRAHARRQGPEGAPTRVRVAHRSAATPAALFDAPPVAAARFTRIVGDRLNASRGGSVLQYSERQDLQREARRLGIARFEANLIIAAVLHRHPTAAAQPIEAVAPARSRLPLTVAIFAGIQAAVGLATWWVLHA